MSQTEFNCKVKLIGSTEIEKALFIQELTTVLQNEFESMERLFK